MTNPTKPILPEGTDVTQLSPELSTYIFEMEEYAEAILRQKTYYRRLASMLCTEIEEGGFSSASRTTEAAAIRHYGICV